MTERTISTFRAQDGAGVVTVSDRYPTGVADLWEAITDPERLARWIATLDGSGAGAGPDLRVGGEFRATFSSGWAGLVRIEVCDPPSRLVAALDPGRPDATVIEARLTADGEATVLTVEERGLPLAGIADFGAGWQAHLEDLLAHLGAAGGPRWAARWAELAPVYAELWSA